MYFDHRLKLFQQDCPDLAQTVTEAHARFARGDLSAEQFARIFSEADLAYIQRHAAPVQPRKPPGKAIKPAPPAAPLFVPKVHFKLPIAAGQEEDMALTLHQLYRYAHETLMNALREVVKSREMAKQFHVVYDADKPVLEQLRESARNDEREYNAMLKKRPRPSEDEEENEAVRAHRAQMQSMNETALSMLPKRAEVTTTKRPRSSAPKKGNVVTRDDLVKALIHLKTHDGVLGRSWAVLKRLTMGI